MRHRRFPTVALTILILFGLLFLGASAIQRSAWNQGFLMGQLAAGGQDGAITPYLPYALGYGGGPSPLRVLFGLGLLFLLLIAAGRLFRWRVWRMADGPQREQWAQHWRKHHGHRPPCFQEGDAEGQAAGDEPKQAPPETAEQPPDQA